MPTNDGDQLAMHEREGEANRADTVVKSAPFVTVIDDFQYGTGEGPCITAAQTGHTMRSGSLGGDPRWPRFGPRAGRLGVHSALSLPLLIQDKVVGVMNVYAHRRIIQRQRRTYWATVRGARAIAVQNAQILAQTQRLAANMQKALINPGGHRPGHRHPDQPQRHHPEEAFNRLGALSQGNHHKVTVAATSIVEEAARRARSRHTGT